MAVVVAYFGVGGVFSTAVGVCNVYNGLQLFSRYHRAYPEFLAPKPNRSTLDNATSACLRYGLFWGVYGLGSLSLKLAGYTVAWPVVAYAMIQDAKRGSTGANSHFCPGRSVFFLESEYDLLAKHGKLLLPLTSLNVE